MSDIKERVKEVESTTEDLVYETEMKSLEKEFHKLSLIAALLEQRIRVRELQTLWNSTPSKSVPRKETIEESK